MKQKPDARNQWGLNKNKGDGLGVLLTVYTSAIALYIY